MFCLVRSRITDQRPSWPWSRWAHFGFPDSEAVRCLRDFQSQHHDGDQDGNDPITEGFQSPLRHLASSPASRGHRPLTLMHAALQGREIEERG
jgi:hypothetical protein